MDSMVSIQNHPAWAYVRRCASLVLLGCGLGAALGAVAMYACTLTFYGRTEYIGQFALDGAILGAGTGGLLLVLTSWFTGLIPLVRSMWFLTIGTIGGLVIGFALTLGNPGLCWLCSILGFLCAYGCLLGHQRQRLKKQ